MLPSSVPLWESATLYRCSFKVPFRDAPIDPALIDYQERLTSMIAQFDRAASADLVVPAPGTMRCVATGWDGASSEGMGERLSGDEWTFTFTEDES